jgi:hypothetical protein
MRVSENERGANSAVRTRGRGDIGPHSAGAGVLQCEQVREVITPLPRETRSWVVTTRNFAQP